MERSYGPLDGPPDVNSLADILFATPPNQQADLIATLIGIDERVSEVYQQLRLSIPDVFPVDALPSIPPLYSIPKNALESVGEALKGGSFNQDVIDAVTARVKGPFQNGGAALFALQDLYKDLGVVLPSDVWTGSSLRPCLSRIISDLIDLPEEGVQRCSPCTGEDTDDPRSYNAPQASAAPTGPREPPRAAPPLMEPLQVEAIATPPKRRLSNFFHSIFHRR